MKYIKFALSLLLTVAIFYGLNSKFGNAPSLGKFLNPSKGFWQNEKDEAINGTVQIEGLADDVTIHYDEQLIPHVFAKNDIDLYRAQGYITAKHRLWQMEFQTYAAAGRLSEIIGEAALNFDRKQRRIGMNFGAELSLNKMNEDPKTKACLEAYRDGVNSYIKQLKPDQYPVEYKLLGYEPELWTVKKSALLLMFMTEKLTNSVSDLEYTNALQKFGKARFDLLFPDFFDVSEPVIPKDTDWSFVKTEITEKPQNEFELDSIAETIDKAHPDNGSNNWVVSGEKSYSGNPILANDPHLGYQLPSIWFVMQLSTPEHKVYGATLPGAISVISGFNNNISWGITNATRDVVDWYKIDFKDESRNEYRYDNKWKKTSIRIEEIKIKGKKTFVDSVIYTHHGPVTYDHNFKGNGQNEGLAMKWIGHMGGNTQRTFIELNKSKNYSDYLNAIKHYNAPAQNFVFASKEGDIALWVQGLFPNKWEGQGKFLMDGSNPEHDWQSFIPQAYNAHAKNPQQGFLSSANQHPVDESYPFYVFNDGYEIYRNRMINNFLRSKDILSIQDFKDLQNNNYSLRASEMLPYILVNMDTSGLTDEESRILSMLKKWDYNMEIDEAAPTIWSIWWQKIYYNTWDEFRVKDLALDYPFRYQTGFLLKNHPDNEFMDIVATPEKETSKDLFLIAFKETVAALTKVKDKNGSYNWGDYKATIIGHLLQKLPAFSRLNVPVGGASKTVNASSKSHGPSWRMIVEMSSPPKAYGIYPGGQSGNPGSKYYDDFIDRWAAGEYFDLLFMQNENSVEKIIGTQHLTTK